MMCDVRLIYLENNKFSEIKCKPELLSPLPKPKSLKREFPPQSLVSLTSKLVVGILDESQSSCTLVSLPHSPETSKIELAKQDISMKLAVETSDLKVSTSPRPVEMSTVNLTNEKKLDPMSSLTKKLNSSLTSDQTIPNELPTRK